MSGITSEQHDMLRHALGLNYDPPRDRNYYADSPDNEDCKVLVKKGMFKKYRQDPEDMGGLAFFRVSNFGERIARGKLLGG